MLKNPNFDEVTETLDVTPVIGAIYDVKRTVENIQIPEPKDCVEVTNLDEIHLSLKTELSDFLKRLSTIIKNNKVKYPKSLEVSNFPKQKEYPSSVSVSNLGELSTLLSNLLSAIQSINFNPQINVEAPKAPEVVVPTPIVTVAPTQVEIDVKGILQALKPLQHLSSKASNPVSVRLSDGQKFVKALQAVQKSADKLGEAVSNPGVIYAGSSGISQDEMRTVVRESSGLEIPRYDYMSRTLSAADQETYVYKQGGSSGTVVATVVINYTDATLGTILNVSKS